MIEKINFKFINYLKYLKIPFLIIVAAVVIIILLSKIYQKSKASNPRSSIHIFWNVALPGSGSVSLPSLDYDSQRNQIMVAWQDGRNDPKRNADGYGPEYNDDIYALLLDVDAETGPIISEELTIANRGRYKNLEPPRFDNESYVNVAYDKYSDLYAISWMMIPDAALDVSYQNDLLFNKSSCTDVSFRTFDPKTKSLSPIFYDLSQIPPDHPEYEYSCQQEPEIEILEGGKSLVVWNSLQNRYQKNNGYNVSKDIYAKIIDNQTRAVPDHNATVLITKDNNNNRAPNNQEFPLYIARGKTRLLLVWSDNRPGEAGVWGQFFDLQGNTVGRNFRIIPSSVNCTNDSACVKQQNYLFRPTVGYLENKNSFIVVVSKKTTQGDKTDNLLTMAIIESNEDLFNTYNIRTKDIENTLTEMWSYPSLACSKNECVLVYRKGSKILSRRINEIFDFVDETSLDNLPSYAYQDYPKIISANNLFFVAYGSYLNNRSEIRLAKLTVLSESASSSTITPSSISLTQNQDYRDKIGIGQCHSASEIKNKNVNWFYPSGEVLWSVLQPEKDVYDFSKLDIEIQKARDHGKKIWIQVLVSNPWNDPAIPAWAKKTETNENGVPTTPSGDPIQFNPTYLDLHKNILQKIAEKYDNQNYQDVITAIIMQGGGSYGEMTLEYKYCPGGAPAGQTADVQDPKNIYIQEMANIHKIEPEVLTQRDTNGNWVFDNYYIESVKKIVDIYADTFKLLPVVILEGYGLSCQQRVFNEVADYAIGKYGNKFWLKTNGWGSFIEVGRKQIFAKYKTKTHIVFEVGHPSFWCSYQNNPSLSGSGYYSCQHLTNDQAINHNNQSINYAINSGAVSVCFQDVFFSEPNKYQVDMDSLKERLITNYLTNLAVPTPTPTSTSSTLTASPTPTPTSTSSTLTASPTPTPTSTSSTLTASPTPTATSTANTSYIRLNLSLKFQGIQKKPNEAQNKMVVKVSIKKGNLLETKTGDFVTTDGQTWRNGVIPFSLPAGERYYILVKGPKHIQKRICESNPRETYPGSYTCDQGNITLQSGINDLDLSGIYLLAGDLPEQDGIVNAYDSSLVRQCLGKNDASCLSWADLNLDGIVNAQDYSLVIEALSIKSDEK